MSEIDPRESFDAVINLAGAPIVQRWTKKYKIILKQSRVDLTTVLIERLEKCPQPPQVFISGSAIGYYGPQADNELTESSPPQPSFSHELCAAWEQAASKAKELGSRVCLLRTGIVLGRHGGALARMRLPFLLGIGGPVGTGSQWMSWIHISDMVRIIHHCLMHTEAEGVINATAPKPVRNQFFAKTYAQVLHRMAIVPMPAFVLRIIFGQMAQELLLTGQKVIPSKLLNDGFTFTYPDLEMALLSLEKTG
jgi:uncharacterized protein (TIGR01777 family)